MGKRVLVNARDLTFRAKLRAIVEAAGGQVVGVAEAEVAVVEVGVRGWEEQVAELVGRGVAVLAFGPHVEAGLLRTARERGVVAVPNSQVAETLRGMM